MRVDELTRLPYDKRWKKYRLQLEPSDIKTNKALIVELIRMARGLPVEPLNSGPEPGELTPVS